VKGFSELLNDPSLSKTEGEKYLNVIQKKISNLIMTVDLFYELSQMDSYENRIVMEKLFLDQIVVESMLLFYDDFEKSRLEVHIDEETLPPIFADLKATNRIVTNIIQNVLRYAKSYMTIRLIEKDNYIQLTAANDVEKFDHTKLNKIF